MPALESKILAYVVLVITSLSLLGPVVAPWLGYLPPAWAQDVTRAIALAGTLHLWLSTSPLASLLASRRAAAALDRVKALAAKGAPIACLAALAVALSGCSWWATNKAIVSSALAACEITYVATDPAPTPAGAVSACVGLVLSDAVSLFETLSKQVDSAGAPTPLAVKARLGRGH